LKNSKCTLFRITQKKENEMVSNCHQLKLKAADGGMGADTKTTN
jgi:hypothetical protein